MVYKNFDKVSSSGAAILEIMSNYGLLDLATRHLAEELHKPIIKIRKTKSILIRKYNKWFRFLLCVISIFS